MNRDSKFDHRFQEKIQEVKRMCIERRRFRWLIRFAMTTALFTILATLLFQLAGDAVVMRQMIAYSFLAAEVFLAWLWLFRPLRKPITDEQVALFIDENYPELQNRAVSMVTVGAQIEDKTAPPLSVVAEHFLSESQVAVRKSAFAYAYHDDNFDKQTWTVATLLAASLLIMYYYRAEWVPSFVGGPVLGWGAKLGDFTVEPGNARVRAGDDLLILVKSQKTGKAVSIRWREGGGSWQTAPMKLGDSDFVRFHRFANIAEPIDYRIEFGGRSSRRFAIRVWTPPEVDAVDVTYRYPDYLAMPPREVPNSGHISALEGSSVSLRVHVNKPIRKATAVFESGEKLRLRRDGALAWRGDFQLSRDDRYHIELVDRAGEASLFNPAYDVKAQQDTPPSVKIAFPYRDMQVSPLDEIAFQFKVVDDFGLESFGLQYQVAGREPQTLDLSGSDDPGLDAEGDRLIMLEELNLEPGDLITWTVWARDRKPDRPEFETFSDPYFLETRPFRLQFREAVSNQNAGAMGMQGGGGSDMIRQQKEALIAVWNLRRRLSRIDGETFIADNDRILQAQTQIRDQVKAGAAMSDNPLAAQLDQAVEKAVAHLQAALWPDPAADLTAAAVNQQMAYRLMLKLEPPDAQVGRQRAMGGGMGGGRQRAGMGDLEMSRNRNFYEDERRTQMREEAASQALNNIRDLARRQKMVNDEIAKLISELDSDESRRREIERRLERLREELRKNIEKLDQMQQTLDQMDPQLANDARERLDQARDQMNRGLENLEDDRLQEARSAGANAAGDLRNLEEELKSQARGSVSERLADLQRQTSEMEALQERIREKVAEMQKDKDSPKLDAASAVDQRKGELLEDKKRLAEQFKRVMDRAADTAELAANNQEALSRKLGDWLRQSSREGVPEAIEETRDLVEYGIWEDLSDRERDIAEKLGNVAAGLEEASEQWVADDVQAREKALGEIERLLEQARAMQQGDADERMRQFVERDFKEWSERLRNAENFLGGNGVAWEDVRAVRREIEKFRRMFRREELAPKFDLFLRAVVNPLFQTAERLQTDIDALRQERRFVLANEGEIPEKYRKQVAHYFETLSETERDD